MQKPSIFTLLFLFAYASTFGQVSERLQRALNDETDKFHQIRIEFKENVDCYALNHEFKQQQVKVTDRPKIVITQLQEQAQYSQSPVNALLHGRLKNDVRNVHSFWIVNTMILEANSKAVSKLSEVSTVSLIDIEDSDIIPHDPIIRGEESASRAPNGVEPGLVAINAPAMWALGYTGRGRLSYCYDTGVWPTHPAFAERFMAHRYPLEQCWTGFFSDEPNGNVSDHGTHVLGTMAGLVEETNDTIGVAFESYWIANDFVTSTVEGLPPLAAMMGAFEWALNPDGDINTTEDIPDVINNSWRWRDDPDTVQCAGMVVNLMNAIEAAGIANIFSGGNSGPSNSTVNAPQRINTSEVNTFSVGSVNGNGSFPYPISNFSTRGPKQCPHSGSVALEIHPEVVAPGQNVRSAWGDDNFNTISGTSMASPHVSGAILLLKEAFPYLTGEDLMWALYETTVDLGDPGEDNVFGRGIIDVHAAFLHLSQNNTPVDPTDVPWDLHISGATNPSVEGMTCDDSFVVTVEFENRGDNPITSVLFEYNINGGTNSTATWNGNLNPGESTTFELPAISTTEYGNLGLNILGSIIGQTDEYEFYNNRWRVNFNRRELRSLPFTEGFEGGLELNNWFVINPDGNTTWETIETGGLNWNGSSATVQLYNYSPRSNQRDGLVSPMLDIPSTAEPVWLIFDLAYQSRSASLSVRDTLQIYTSSDCGANFDQLIYDKSGEELGTRDTNQINFMPQFEWDWRTDSVDLSAYAGQEVMLGFQTINRKGNNVYIDNIRVFTGNTEPASVIDYSEYVNVYPNPTSQDLFIESNNSSMIVSDVVVRNMLGQQTDVVSTNGTNRTFIETRNLTPGVYLVEFNLDEHRVVKQFVKH